MLPHVCFVTVSFFYDIQKRMSKEPFLVFLQTCLISGCLMSHFYCLLLPDLPWMVSINASVNQSSPTPHGISNSILLFLVALHESSDECEWWTRTQFGESKWKSHSSSTQRLLCKTAQLNNVLKMNVCWKHESHLADEWPHFGSNVILVECAFNTALIEVFQIAFIHWFAGLAVFTGYAGLLGWFKFWALLSWSGRNTIWQTSKTS